MLDYYLAVRKDKQLVIKDMEAHDLKSVLEMAKSIVYLNGSDGLYLFEEVPLVINTTVEVHSSDPRSKKDN